MLSLFPHDWIIAHRCVDLSDRLGSATLATIIDAAKGDENTLTAMQKRFQDGFGIETDLRGDYRTANAGILINHNPPVYGETYPTLDAVFDLYATAGAKGCLALNIKDAGLQSRLKPLLDRFGIKNYFTFDGANPDVLVDGQSGITAFGRESEIEPFNAGHIVHPLANYPTIAGVWLDNFTPNMWIDEEVMARHFANGKDVALVSPELHLWARDDRGETCAVYWRRYREILRKIRAKYPQRRMMICTKFPAHAAAFFNE